MIEPSVGAALVVEGVTVRYGVTTAVCDVDLTVAAGEVVAVVGPSGCGKSTLLRAIAGLEPMASGRVLAGGRDLAGVPTHRRGLGLMFQDHALFPHETVAGNIAFGLRMAGATRHEQKHRVADLLAMVGLEGFAERRVDGLSGGEAQRVALARALAPSPALLMLDEPLGSLDRVLREQLTADLRHLLGDAAVSALHVTHDQAEAFAVADRIVVLRAGRIEQQGRPEELWRSPASRFVAEFLGHPNLWPTESGTTLVPITALRPDPAGELTVVVVDAVFTDGRFRVAATANGRSVVFESAERPMPGAEATLAIDHAQTRRLADRVTRPSDSDCETEPVSDRSAGRTAG